MNLFGHQWKYINEGDFHIVLQLCGTAQVLRLIKKTNEECDLSQQMKSVDFVNNVMIPLVAVTEDYHEELVEVTEEQCTTLSQDLHHLRPTHRLHKTNISRHAILAPNLIILTPKCENNYSIEIKAKEGFLTPAFQKHNKCYYCMKQFLKAQEGQIAKRSSYCPLDLFSGNRRRMKIALKSLIENPQNNFRIFCNGDLVYNDKKRVEINDLIKSLNVFKDSVDLFINFIIEILLGDAKNNLYVSNEGHAPEVKPEKNHCIENCCLENGSFLHTLLSLQTLVKDYSTIENLKSCNNTDWLTELLDIIHKNELDLHKLADRNVLFENGNKLALGIISAIARDCSIMITFSSNIEDHIPKVYIGGHEIPYKISLTDLETKSVETLKKRNAKEQKIVEVYEKEISKSL